ncbi:MULTISPECIES: SDR family NAD(P)-dependent oxidoreductase [Leucobacter]|uniref:SDR family oxidoreductase n=1 Tax=Leucobacter manosquensis TaxID=2810611 RepID=A0ABS5M0V4_9MICO|nr:MULTISPECIES: SDR family oxidoreductase [Leucobacter]MBS3180605.1 SDR family oxidoreductase [Leucobacter manosquensis]
MTTPAASATRSALVTGAGGALGRAIALRLGQDGFAVGIVGRDGETLRETASLLDEHGIRNLVVDLDLRDTPAIDAAVERVERELGPLEAMVNNAAIYPATPFLDIPLAEYEEVLRVNQIAYFAGSQAAARRMVPRGTGSIVSIGSITFHGGWEHLVSYVSTKGAAVGLTRSLARELGPTGVRVNAVSPGAFPTKAEEINGDPETYNRTVIEKQSIKRRGRNEELASVVSFLVGDDASFVTGQTINVDGGWVME